MHQATTMPPMFQELGTLELQKKRETDAELARLNKATREAPFIKYVDDWLYDHIYKKLEKSPTQDKRPEFIALGARVKMGSLKSIVKSELGEIKSEIFPEERIDARNNYQDELNFIRQSVGLVNGAKSKLENRPTIQKLPSDDIDYTLIIEDMKKIFGELPE